MIEELLKYQEEDEALYKIEKTLIDSEDRKKASAAKKYLDGVEESVNKLDEKASFLVSEFNAATEICKSLKEQAEELSLSVSNVKDQAEAQFFIKKSDELMGEIAKTESQINELSNSIQSIMKEYKSIKNNTASAKETFATHGAKYTELKKGIQAEKEEIEKRLEELKKTVDGELMQKYLSKRNAKIFPVVYRADGKNCGACRFELSMNVVDRLNKGEVVECEHCGRILYQK